MPFEGNLDQIFLGVFDSLADRVRNLAGFADAETNGAVAVAHDDQSGKFEDTSALYRFGNTVDGNDFLL